MSILVVDNVSVAYGKNAIVKKVSFALEKGEIGCLLGPSGCGKTTLLRAIAGFEPVTHGSVNLCDVIVSDVNFSMPPEKRNIGMVFQDFALFPHLNIADNISFGIRHLNKKDKSARVVQLLSLINLEGYGKRYPHELSGGQQQRIALARGLAPKPDLLLMDEPFSSMDVDLREELAREVRIILKQENITAILVTHDQNEAFAMADNIGVMNHGELLQWGSGYELYHEPETLFVADFIGQGVFIDGEVMDDNLIKTTLAPLEGIVPKQCKQGCKVKVLVRPDDIIHDDCSPRKAKIISRVFRGANNLYTLEMEDGTQLLSLVHSHHNHEVGEELGIAMEFEHLVVFPYKQGE
jgi:iron(III) transport system ATP-binding protein